ncbi:unnamed protein product, partial [Didymodactylos carnosus]
MKNIYAEAVTTPNNFVSVTGLTPITFEEVYQQFYAVATERLYTTSRRPHLRLVDRNLLFLIIHWLRCYPTYSQLSLLFGVSPGQISRHIRGFLPDLEQSLKSEIKWPSLIEFEQQVARHPTIGNFIGSIDDTRH